MSADLAELTLAWAHYVGTGHEADVMRDGVIAAYLEPRRAYHGLRHLVWVVRHVQSLAHESAGVGDVSSVIAAAFYHDVIYDPRRDDNEERSARLAIRELPTVGWAPPLAERVGALVRCTIDHAPGDDDHAAAVLCDADLAVLATDPGDYEAYVRGVRREYKHVDDDEWRAGRARVLSSLTGRRSIYLTTVGRDRWEATARANIAAELATLR